jgi:hypothetical protein
VVFHLAINGKEFRARRRHPDDDVRGGGADPVVVVGEATREFGYLARLPVEAGDLVEQPRESRGDDQDVGP